MPYKFLEGLTRADAAYEATGKTLKEVLESAAMALFEIMSNPKKVKPKIKKEFTIKKDTLEELLFNFLDELIFLKDAETMIFHKCEVAVDEQKLELAATVYGETINIEKHELNVDAKAPTMHKFEIKKTDTGYRAQVIIDI